jgi:hypothetical protein
MIPTWSLNSRYKESEQIDAAVFNFSPGSGLGEQQVWPHLWVQILLVI